VIHIFFRSEVLLVHLIMLNFMCLHHVFCGSLGPTKFDIGFPVLDIFENIHLLLILKCHLHYLGLSFIANFACDMSNVV